MELKDIKAGDQCLAKVETEFGGDLWLHVILDEDDGETWRDFDSGDDIDPPTEVAPLPGSENRWLEVIKGSEPKGLLTIWIETLGQPAIACFRQGSWYLNNDLRLGDSHVVSHYQPKPDPPPVRPFA